MRFILNKTEVELPESRRGDRLLWVLRDHFGLRGPKFGCGIGACGACSIHVGGKAERSCSLTVGDVEGEQVTTLEGLASGEKLHPVQAAWIAENVPQCGYCQNGQIMTAAALLEEKPSVTPSEIEGVMSQVRCRCGTQNRVQRAMNRAGEAMKTS